MNTALARAEGHVTFDLEQAGDSDLGDFDLDILTPVVHPLPMYTPSPHSKSFFCFVVDHLYQAD